MAVSLCAGDTGNGIFSLALFQRLHRRGRPEATGKHFVAQVRGILNQIEDRISLITRQNRESPSIGLPGFALGFAIGCSNKEVDP